MNQSPMRDLGVGLFVLAGMIAVAYLTFTVGGTTYRGPGGLSVEAVFDQIGGLKLRAPVVVGGVKIGQVTGIQLDTDLRARVTLEVDQGLGLPSDSSASILTAGILGDQYIELEPGAEDVLLENGDELMFTQNALILERMVGKIVQNLGVDDE